MINIRCLTIGVIAAAASATAALAQQQGGPLPGTSNGAAVASSNREENASYNRVIGKVGSDPVKEEKAKSAARAKPVPATAADIVVGAAVRDVKGAALGKVESIDGDSAILAYSTGKVRFPLVGFGKDANGLLINLSTQDFLALVEKAKTSS